MTSYLSSITSSVSNLQISSRLNSLRRAITSGDEADDPDYEDSSHISKVLRAYYTEKGRPFPPWLPPDPKAPQTTSRENIALVSGRSYSGPQQQADQGSLRGQVGGPVGGYGSGGGGLGDLWSDSSHPSQTQPAPSSSVRGRFAGSGAGGPGGGNATNMTANIGRPSSHSPSDNPYTPGGSAGYTSRPLPSQRAGSIQSTSLARSSGGYERSTTLGSAQDRLRARLHGGATSTSSVSSGSSANSRGVSPIGGTYDQSPGQGYSQGGYERGGEGYSNSAYGGNNSSTRRPVGLPSGPRANRSGR